MASTNYVSGWRAEARQFRGDAADGDTPAMRQHLDLQNLYGRALAAMPDQIDGQPPLPLPQACPLSLDELLGRI